MATTEAGMAQAHDDEELLSPRQTAPEPMEDAIQSIDSMKSRLASLDIDGRADPDAQATITDFLDFTEYLPADMTRSLTLIGKLDQTYIDASSRLFSQTQQWGQLPSLAADERPSPVQLRADISKSLGHTISSRTYSHAEAVRMQENAIRHHNRAKTILSKLQTMLENYPTAEEQQKSPVVAKTLPTRPPRITMRVSDRKARGRNVPRITVPGEVLPPYELDFASYSSSDSSSDEDDEDDKTPVPAPAAPVPAPTAARPAAQTAAQPRIKVVKQTQTVSPKVLKKPRPPPVQSTVPKELLKPPPEGAVIGSADLPWLQLTPWELARLRKRMKKNAQWNPSDTMIARELKALERGPEAYNNAKKLAEEQGRPFEPVVSVPTADANGSEHPPMGALSLDAALAAEDNQTNNVGLKLNMAKKLKKENLARLAAEEAEESARKMREEVNALLNPTVSGLESTPDKSTTETPSRSVRNKYGNRKRKRDSVAPEVIDADKPSGSEPQPQVTKRTKTETPVPLPQHPSNLTSTVQVGPPPAPAPQPINTQSTTPIPIPIGPQEQNGSASKAASMSTGSPAPATTITTTVPVKPPADLAVPPPSPKKSTTPILPPVRETRKSQATKKEQQKEALTVIAATPTQPLSRASTPAGPSSSRPTSRGKASSQEPPQTLAAERARRTSTARNTPTPTLEPKQPGKRPKRPAPGVVSRTNSGGSSAVGRRKAAPRKRAARASKREKGQQAEVEVEIEVDDEGNPIDPDEPKYCLCNRVSFGTMIACENVENCKYEWFHLECVDLEATPARTTKWYCPSCRVALNIGEKGEVSARGVKM